jgi:hypothetical protein
MAALPKLNETSEVRYDASEWPIFRTIIPSQGMTLQALREHLDHVTAVYERREPFALLVDALRTPPLSAMERQLVADTLRFNARRHPGVLRGLAVCLRGTLQRGSFTAIQWLARPPYPIAAFESVPAASVWLARQLKLPTSSHTSVGT